MNDQPNRKQGPINPFTNQYNFSPTYEDDNNELLQQGILLSLQEQNQTNQDQQQQEQTNEQNLGSFIREISRNKKQKKKNKTQTNNFRSKVSQSPPLQTRNNSNPFFNLSQQQEQFQQQIQLPQRRQLQQRIPQRQQIQRNEQFQQQQQQQQFLPQEQQQYQQQQRQRQQEQEQQQIPQRQQIQRNEQYQQQQQQQQFLPQEQQQYQQQQRQQLQQEQEQQQKQLQQKEFEQEQFFNDDDDDDDDNVYNLNNYQQQEEEFDFIQSNDSIFRQQTESGMFNQPISPNNDLLTDHLNFSVENNSDNTLNKQEIELPNVLRDYEINTLKSMDLDTIKKNFKTTNLNKHTRNEKKTPLHLVCEAQNASLEVIRWMIQNGSDTNSKDSSLSTPLHSVCGNRIPHPEIVRFLAENKADVNFANVDGNTALHLFSSSRQIYNPQTISILMQHGAKMNISNLKMQKPSDLSRRNKNLFLRKEIKSFRQNNLLDHKKKKSIKKKSKKKKSKKTCSIRKKKQSKTKTGNKSKKSQPITKKKTTKSKKKSLKSKKTKKKTPNPETSKRMVKRVQKISTFQEISRDELKFQKKVGSGAFKKVWKGKWLGNTVAIAKVKQSKQFTETQIEEFEKEISVLCTLNHPQIVRFYGGCTQNPNKLLLVSEYCSGGDLFSILHSKYVNLSGASKVKIALDIAKGIQYLHAKNFVHRDLKTPNVLLDGSRIAKITDFGLSKTMDVSSTFSNNTIVGTPRWMAPELLRAERNYTNKVDIYAFGIMLWELSTRRTPFAKYNPFELLMHVGIKGQRPDINETDLFYDLIIQCWDQDPKKRPGINTLIEKLKLLYENFHEVQK
ncbi:serine/threonine-protein kinase tnni3k-related [Anaeramoeba flamelloides]|uniref:Serine/threonine-protein kinase tnni3k-related n=1 Tax=Anaeramoeba flamelloides TaxID=1746091 RepID=A0ABQ8X2R8_9EUKA|nr:serine/threonine-protein kinase tnni3k-related [Anaeramoeba flamelloides]